MWEKPVSAAIERIDQCVASTGVEIVTMPAGRSRMEGLLVRTRARRCTAVEILRCDNDIASVPLQLDGGAPARCPAAEHEGIAGVNRQAYAVGFERSLGPARAMTLGHINICQRIQHGLAERSGHGHFLWWILLTILAPCSKFKLSRSN